MNLRACLPCLLNADNRPWLANPPDSLTGECNTNPAYMRLSCRLSCNRCTRAPRDSTHAPGKHPEPAMHLPDSKPGSGAEGVTGDIHTPGDTHTPGDSVSLGNLLPPPPPVPMLRTLEPGEVVVAAKVYDPAWSRREGTGLTSRRHKKKQLEHRCDAEG